MICRGCAMARGGLIIPPLFVVPRAKAGRCCCCDSKELGRDLYVLAPWYNPLPDWEDKLFAMPA